MALLEWGGSNVGVLIHSIYKKRNLLSGLELECQAEPFNQQLSYVRNVVRDELNELIAQENMYWHQRSKISWMKDGDHNSKYFHTIASQKRRSNEIQNSKTHLEPVSLNRQIWRG